MSFPTDGRMSHGCCGRAVHWPSASGASGKKGEMYSQDVKELPSPFRFNVATQHKTSRSGAHPNQMKQLKMILKAQEVYFALHTSTVNKYEDDMTNGGQ